MVGKVDRASGASMTCFAGAECLRHGCGAVSGRPGTPGGWSVLGIWGRSLVLNASGFFLVGGRFSVVLLRYQPLGRFLVGFLAGAQKVGGLDRILDLDFGSGSLVLEGETRPKLQITNRKKKEKRKH